MALFLFTSLEALPIFLEERSIYTREHSRGAYRVISYMLCNFLIYVPVCLVMSVAFTSISYFMVSRRTTVLYLFSVPFSAQGVKVLLLLDLVHVSFFQALHFYYNIFHPPYLSLLSFGASIRASWKNLISSSLPPPSPSLPCNRW